MDEEGLRPVDDFNQWIFPGPESMSELGHRLSGDSKAIHPSKTCSTHPRGSLLELVTWKRLSDGGSGGL